MWFLSWILLNVSVCCHLPPPTPILSFNLTLLSLTLEEAILLEALRGGSPGEELKSPTQPVHELERRYSRSMKSQMTVILADPLMAAKHPAMLL